MQLRTLLTFCFLFSTLLLNAQWRYRYSGHIYSAPEYLWQVPRFQQLNSHLDPAGKGFGEMFTWVGFSVATGFAERNSGGDGLLFFDQLQRRQLPASDSVNCTLNGFRFGISRGIDLLVKQPWVDANVFCGLSYSRLSLRRYAANTAGRYVNPAFLLDLRLDLHFALRVGKFRRIFIGARPAYLLDLSSGKWKRKTALLPQLPKTRLGGPELAVFIGFGS